MLTQKPLEGAQTTAPGRAASRPAAGVVCWFEGDWVPLADAKVGVMTHAFMYGTAVFEGIRGYWNEDQGQLYLLKLREHYERIVDSAKVLLMDHGETVDSLMEKTLELVRRNGFREDVYIRTNI